MKRFLVVLVALMAIGAGVLEWTNASWTEPGPPAPQGQKTVILVPAHSRLHDIAQELQDRAVLRNGLMFELGLHLRGLAGQVKAGEYAVPSRASPADIAAILVSGKSIQHKLTVAEGLTSEMIWKLVQADPVLVGDAGHMPPPEGTLLPETYLFTRGTSRAQLLARMRDGQRKFLAAHWAARAPGLPFTDPDQAVTMASIVEKETALPQERRHIAQVFVNRLKNGMRIQSDPTIIYDLTRGYPLGRGIRESELLAATPHNTYVIAGLPPGPICNPGKDSLAAVLDPAPGDDLYFVANGKGGHVFAATLADHARNVAAWRAIERLRADIKPAPVFSPRPAR
jgi:UPF0755 protein